VAESLIIAIRGRNIAAHKTNANLSPRGPTSLQVGSFDLLSHIRDDIGAAALPYAECIQPIGIFRVVFLKDGSIKALPSLPPVIHNCLHDSFIFGANVWTAAMLRNLAREKRGADANKRCERDYACHCP